MASLLQYYLVRPARKMQTESGFVRIPESKVPMIPIDILPEWIEIFGLPRSLRDSYAVGLTSLGHVEQPEEKLEVRLHRVDPSVYERAMPHGSVSHLSGHSGVLAPNTMKPAQTKPARTTPGDCVQAATLDELRKQRGERPDSESYVNTTEPGRPALDAPRKLDAEMPAAQKRQAAEAGRSLRAAPPEKQQGTRTAAGGAPASSKESLVAAPNGLSSSVHARRDLSVEMAAGTGIVSAAPSSRDQLSAARGLQLLGSESMRKPMHGAKKKIKTPGARRYCHYWCHHGVCKWGAECHYHHAMPATGEGLREVGLKDYPPWWAELSGPSMGTRQCGRMGLSAARRKTPSGQETIPHELERNRGPVSRSKTAVLEDAVSLAARPSEEPSRLRLSGSLGVAHGRMQFPPTSSLVDGKDVIQDDGRRERATPGQKLVDID
ncbi:hypothetical protein PpBr36_08770 [Pyricularia pennisetigena]|uniref:hypothetical protein n=1 Tax=Pyricularia pennisetigena TaxID=1578925 RepID=UPI00114F5034|nr:hypothetical protein PpBr36_08770 [Pyricularia pennisetigena]TLS24448.1 hypothetical protein PpBr36_08770 [Pyricularia pennisetigena]